MNMQHKIHTSHISQRQDCSWNVQYNPVTWFDSQTDITVCPALDCYIESSQYSSTPVQTILSLQQIILSNYIIFILLATVYHLHSSHATDNLLSRGNTIIQLYEYIIYTCIQLQVMALLAGRYKIHWIYFQSALVACYQNNCFYTSGSYIHRNTV